MKKVKKSIALLIVLVMGLGLLAACGSGDTGPAADGGTGTGAGTGGGETPVPTVPEVGDAPVDGANLADHIDLIVDTALQIVNPFTLAGTGAPVAWASFMILDRLLEQPEPGVFAAQLAVRWYTEDYQHFRFYLRDDVYFHNGDHFTAEDVVWNVEFAHANPGSPAFGRWRFVDTITAVDTYVIEIVLTEPHVDFFFDIANYYTSIHSPRAFYESQDDPTWGHIGTGPFRVVGFSSNDFLSLERFDEYWGGPAPTRSITMWTIPEMATRTVMLQNGEAQVSFSMTPEDLDFFEDSPDFQTFVVRLNPPIILGFNNQGDEIMMCRYFRRAVAHALNTEDISLAAMGRWAQPPWDGNFWGPETQFRLENMPQRAFDLELARYYLDRSVYNGETIEIMTAVHYNIRASEFIQLLLGDVGINVNVETTDISGFIEAHRFDPEDDSRQMHIFAVGMLPVALQAMRTTFYPGIGTNRLNINNDYLTGLIDELAATIEPDARRDIAHQIQEFFWEDIPAIPLWWRLQGIPAVNGIGGMRLSADQFNYCLRGIFWDLDQAPAHLMP